MSQTYRDVDGDECEATPMHESPDEGYVTLSGWGKPSHDAGAKYRIPVSVDAHVAYGNVNVVPANPYR